MPTDAQIETLTRAVIREKTAELLARERELTERAAAMFQNGGGAAAPAITERGRRLHDRARELLDGAGTLLPALPEGQSEGDVLSERESVRIALRALQRADLQQEAVEAAQWAIKATPQFQTLQREWLLAAARFLGVEQRAQAFLATARTRKQLSSRRIYQK